MAQAQDFKRIHTKSYKVWRLLQAPGCWGKVYREREMTLRNFSSAIIFPEQLLGLNQSQLFTASLSVSSEGRSASVSGMTIPSLLLDGGTVGYYDDIYDWESENNGDDALKSMSLGRPGSYNNTPFWSVNLFTNRKDAVKMASRHLEKF
jgi:hypothetical protein